MTDRQRRQLVNGNRMVIFVLTVTGMSLDGFVRADALLAVAALGWLWLPQWVSLESKLLRQLEEVRHNEQGNESRDHGA